MIQFLVVCLYVLIIPVFWSVFAVLLARLPEPADQPPVARKGVLSVIRRGVGDDSVGGVGDHVDAGAGEEPEAQPSTHFHE
ncbi:hypothetical protein ACLB3A_00405 [Corynebacterium freneyi]|uniref:hypothetical protein n=1 Tax=Corynebacterium freneyi TaxID=134034 RepID=UPI00396C2CDC